MSTARHGDTPYRRRTASRRQWAAIIREKTGPCRVCGSEQNGRVETRIHLHRLVSRPRGGDDVPDNVVPLCRGCYELVVIGDEATLVQLSVRLTKNELAYVKRKFPGVV